MQVHDASCMARRRWRPDRWTGKCTSSYSYNVQQQQLNHTYGMDTGHGLHWSPRPPSCNVQQLRAFDSRPAWTHVVGLAACPAQPGLHVYVSMMPARVRIDDAQPSLLLLPAGVIHHHQVVVRTARCMAVAIKWPPREASLSLTLVSGSRGRI